MAVTGKCRAGVGAIGILGHRGFIFQVSLQGVELGDESSGRQPFGWLSRW